MARIFKGEIARASRTGAPLEDAGGVSAADNHAAMRDLQSEIEAGGAYVVAVPPRRHGGLTAWQRDLLRRARGGAFGGFTTAGGDGHAECPVCAASVDPTAW